MREFQSSHAWMASTTRLRNKVLSEYNPCEQARSSVEDDFRLALVVDGDETDRKELLKLLSIQREKGVDGLRRKVKRVPPITSDVKSRTAYLWTNWPILTNASFEL